MKIKHFGVYVIFLSFLFLLCCNTLAQDLESFAFPETSTTNGMSGLFAIPTAEVIGLKKVRLNIKYWKPENFCDEGDCASQTSTFYNVTYGVTNNLELAISKETVQVSASGMIGYGFTNMLRISLKYLISEKEEDSTKPFYAASLTYLRASGLTVVGEWFGEEVKESVGGSETAIAISGMFTKPLSEKARLHGALLFPLSGKEVLGQSLAFGIGTEYSLSENTFFQSGYFLSKLSGDAIAGTSSFGATYKAKDKFLLEIGVAYSPFVSKLFNPYLSVSKSF